MQMVFSSDQWSQNLRVQDLLIVKIR